MAHHRVTCSLVAIVFGPNAERQCVPRGALADRSRSATDWAFAQTALPACVAAISIPITLSSCQPVAPPYRRPRASVAESYPADAPPTGEALSARALDWRDVFTSRDLQRLIEVALQNSRDLRIAVLRVEEAHALRGIQRADRFPNVGVTAADDRTRTPAGLSFRGAGIDVIWPQLLAIVLIGSIFFCCGACALPQDTGAEGLKSHG